MWPKIFNRRSGPVSEAERLLTEWGYDFEKLPDGTLFMPSSSDLVLAGRGLTKLPDLTKVVVTNFSCGDNQLTSLEGAPQKVSGIFFCYNNKLTTLKGAPPSVGNDFWCFNNPLLKNLEGAPTQFRELASDFGTFSSWDQVPEELRLSPETRLRHAQECVRRIQEATVLQKNVAVKRPLKIRSGWRKSVLKND